MVIPNMDNILKLSALDNISYVIVMVYWFSYLSNFVQNFSDGFSVMQNLSVNHHVDGIDLSEQMLTKSDDQEITGKGMMQQ